MEKRCGNCAEVFTTEFGLGRYDLRVTGDGHVQVVFTHADEASCRAAQRARVRSDAASPGMQVIRMLQGRPLESMTQVVYGDGLDGDFFPALIAAFPDGDPSAEEVAAFERDYRRQLRT